MFSEIFLTLVFVAGLGISPGGGARTAAQAPKPQIACVSADAPAVELIIGGVPFARTDVARVSLIDDYGRTAVEIAFTPAGAEIFAALTQAAVGEELSIMVSGRVVAAPRVMEPIFGGKVHISGPTEGEARALAAAFSPVCS